MATPLRAIRVSDELWEALQEKAAANGTDASSVIRELVAEWLSRK